MASQQPTKSPTLWASRPSTRTRLRQCLSCLDLLAHSWIKKEKRTDVNGPQSCSESSSVRQCFVQWHAVKSFHSLPTLQPHHPKSAFAPEAVFILHHRAAPYALTQNLFESLHNNLSSRKIASPWSTQGPMHLVQDP